MSNADETPGDRFPSLDEAFARRVQAGLEKRFENEAPKIAWDQWVKLKSDLKRYAEDAEYYRGFAKKGDAASLRDVSKKSAKLQRALEVAVEKGFQKSIDDEIAPMALSDLEGLLGKLEDSFALDGKIAPDHADTSRVTLFVNFEAWWKSVTEVPAAINQPTPTKPIPTPFMYVANEVFNLPGMPPPTGASYKSLKDFRRAAKAEKARHKKLAEALKRLHR